MTHIFGPVPSRRLGYSLGIDIVTPKLCTLDCIYCQAGKTTKKTVERKEWINHKLIIDELDEALRDNKKIDYITFSGSGEPTLNSGIGKIIRHIKQICSIPVAVITNSTLLYMPELQKDLMEADLVVPSLDAASPDTFSRINRPHPDISLEKTVEGIRSFSRNFSGEIWLEVMLVRKVNDSMKEIQQIKNLTEAFRIDKIQINSISRPAQDETLKAASKQTLDLARNIFGEKAKIIETFRKDSLCTSHTHTESSIVELLKRRPCSIKQLAQSLGLHETVVLKHLAAMLSEKKITAKLHKGEKYYRAF
jgi:wyosine [tRNA(Phe)-imidazoG37] synthetase (radical SAM superfamily)